jgi:hypothetical protein
MGRRSRTDSYHGVHPLLSHSCYWSVPSLHGSGSLAAGQRCLRCQLWPARTPGLPVFSPGPAAGRSASVSAQMVSCADESGACDDCRREHLGCTQAHKEWSEQGTPTVKALSPVRSPCLEDTGPSAEHAGSQFLGRVPPVRIVTPPSRSAHSERSTASDRKRQKCR